MTARYFILMASLLLWACGGQATEPSEESSTGDESELVEETQEEAPDPELQQALGLNMQLGVNRAALERELTKTGNDCERANELRDKICTLSGTLCDMASRHEELMSQCERGKVHCDKGKADVKDARCR